MAKTALITGASSGIGKELAKKFASEGFDIIACSADEKRLSAACDELRAEHADRTFTEIAIDLSTMEGPQALYDEVQKLGMQIDVVVNDAGIGWKMPFAELSLERIDEIVHVNIRALTILTRLFLADMLARNSGSILQLGSIAGFQPGPLMAVYHASKAYVVSLCDSLNEEIRDSKVVLTCLCPGATDTAFFERAGAENANVHTPSQLMDPKDVAEAAYKGLMNGEHIVVPGAMNKIMTFSRRVMPRELGAKLGRKMYEESTEEA